MDLNTLILGIVPPAMAVIAELSNPVSKNVIKSSVTPVSRELARRMPTNGVESQVDYDVDVDVDNTAEAIAQTAVGTAEISGMIPTWISFTAGLAAILSDRLAPCWCLAIVGLWTAISGILGIKFFSSLDYYQTSHENVQLIGFTVSRAERISWGLIAMNLIVMVAVLAFYKYG